MDIVDIFGTMDIIDMDKFFLLFFTEYILTIIKKNVTNSIKKY